MQLLSCIHWYGKERRPGRKMGHINVSGQNEQELAQHLCRLAEILDNTAFPELEGFAQRFSAKVSS